MDTSRADKFGETFPSFSCGHFVNRQSAVGGECTRRPDGTRSCTRTRRRLFVPDAGGRTHVHTRARAHASGFLTTARKTGNGGVGMDNSGVWIFLITTCVVPGRLLCLPLPLAGHAVVTRLRPVQICTHHMRRHTGKTPGV